MWKVWWVKPHLEEGRACCCGCLAGLRWRWPLFWGELCSGTYNSTWRTSAGLSIAAMSSRIGVLGGAFLKQPTWLREGWELWSLLWFHITHPCVESIKERGVHWVVFREALIQPKYCARTFQNRRDPVRKWAPSYEHWVIKGGAWSSGPSSSVLIQWA